MGRGQQAGGRGQRDWRMGSLAEGRGSETPLICLRLPSRAREGPAGFLSDPESRLVCSSSPVFMVPLVSAPLGQVPSFHSQRKAGRAERGKHTEKDLSPGGPTAVPGPPPHPPRAPLLRYSSPGTALVTPALVCAVSGHQGLPAFLCG